MTVIEFLSTPCIIAVPAILKIEKLCDLNFVKLLFLCVKSKTTPHLKADALIEILKRRGVTRYHVFCDLLRNHNPDLADLLAESSSESDFV